MREIALARTAVTAVSSFAMIVTIRWVGVPGIAMLAGLLRPAMAAIVMTGTVLLVQHIVLDQPLLRLALAAASGAAAYVGSLLTLWHLAGRPDSSEGDAFTLFAARLRALPWCRAATPGRPEQ